MLDFQYDGEEQTKLRREDTTPDDYSIAGVNRFIWCKSGMIVDWWPLAGGVLYSYHPWKRIEGSFRWEDKDTLLYGWFYDTSTWQYGFSTPLDALLNYISIGVDDGDEVGTRGLEAVKQIQTLVEARVRV